MSEKIFLIVLIILIVVLAAVILAKASQWFWDRGDGLVKVIGAEEAVKQAELRQQNLPVTVAIANKAQWQVEVADDSWERARGLSGRETLAADKGMLFIFDYPDIYRFWMRGMKFSLDFIWIKTGSGPSTGSGLTVGQVVDVTKNAPSAGLKNLAFYYSSEPVNMVLEVNAGSVVKYNIRVGDRVVIK